MTYSLERIKYRGKHTSKANSIKFLANIKLHGDGARDMVAWRGKGMIERKRKEGGRRKEEGCKPFFLVSILKSLIPLAKQILPQLAGDL